MTLTIVGIIVTILGIVVTCVGIGQAMRKNECAKAQVIVQGDVIVVMDKDVVIKNGKVKKAIK